MVWQMSAVVVVVGAAGGDGTVRNTVGVLWIYTTLFATL
jgi:diacylglycerol kinase family enzyme